ncbi:hypothetical protein [Sulfobacillus thermosulfidooxidans]|uniref:hypothetical protein n=1 Tax=Sulfobacillus thermosulfidooxidans TaxID=28034 RepID=UPI0006B5958E|nr:hypothetical protein [Sulfobacillus thermosulfidooxidans]
MASQSNANAFDKAMNTFVANSGFYLQIYGFGNAVLGYSSGQAIYNMAWGNTYSYAFPEIYAKMMTIIIMMILQEWQPFSLWGVNNGQSSIYFSGAQDKYRYAAHISPVSEVWQNFLNDFDSNSTTSQSDINWLDNI